MKEEEAVWLKARIPQWRGTAHKKKERGKWLDGIVKEFSTTFGITEGSQNLLRHRIRHWFYNHGAEKGAPPPVAPAPTIDLSSRQPRKLVPLTLSQAYACLFCQKGSPVYEEILKAWKLYREADDAVLKKYHHILPAEHKPNMPFVGFQQIILRDRVSRASKDDLEDLQQFIDERFEAETELRERPWTALKVTEAQSEADLEREYLVQQVENLSTTLDAACREVKRVTNFNSFVIYGGPSPKGTGGLQIWHVGSSRSVMTGQSFQEFLRPLWGVLKDKYGEWLNTTYSYEELLRKEHSVDGASPAPASPSNRTPRPSPSPDPETSSSRRGSQPSSKRGSRLASKRTSQPSPKCAPRRSSRHVPRLSSNRTSPSPSGRVSPSNNTSPSPSGRVSPSNHHSPSPSGRVSPSNHRSPSPSGQVSPSNHRSPSPSGWVSPSNHTPPSPPGWVALSNHTSPVLESEEESMLLDTSPPLSHTHRSLTPTPPTPPATNVSAHDTSTFTSSLSRPTSPQSPPVSRTQTVWSPTHDPVWVLGPQHRGYLHAASSFLLGVPGGPEWENLLARYILFEGLSSSRPGTCKMPTQPRPDELGRWFKWGRLYDRKHLPEIEDLEVFEEQWTAWWSAAQPRWRETESWPFEQVDATGRDWGKLPDGGKDRLFLVVVSLGWWIHALDPSEESVLDNAIADVTWVLENLIRFLSVDIIADSDSPSDTPSPPPQKRRPHPTKIGPPRKRARS